MSTQITIRNLSLVFLSLFISFFAAAQINVTPFPSNCLNPPVQTISVNDISCFGADDGEICFNITGGTPGYINYLNTYPAFTPVGIIQGQIGCFPNLVAGDYILRTRDAVGCMVYSQILTITEPAPLQSQFVFNGNGCGVDDGCLYVNGGTPSYGVWVYDCPNPIPNPLPAPILSPNNPPVVNGFTLSSVQLVGNANNTVFCGQNIPNGDYCILTVDENGCHVWETIQVNNGPGITASFNLINNDCNGGDACLNISGGTTPYNIWAYNCTNPANLPNPIFDSNGNPTNITFTLSGVNFGQNANGMYCADDIPSGDYCILIADANDCWEWLQITIAPVSGPSTSVQINNQYCDGSVDACLNVSGGAQPYQLYVYDCVGPYSGPVSFDANGNPQVNLVPNTNVSFSQNASGTQWCAMNVAPGDYCILVVDANLCWVWEEISVAPAANPIVADWDASASNLSCGDDSGCLNISGGTPMYSVYVYDCPNPIPNPIPTPNFNNNPPTVTGFNLSTFQFPQPNQASDPFCAQGIPVGDYCVLIVDANNCYTWENIQVTGSGSFTADFTQTAADCQAQTGDGCIDIQGGVAPFDICVYTCPNPLPPNATPIFSPTNVCPTIQGANLTNIQFVQTVNNMNTYCAQGIPVGDYCALVLDANGCWIIIEFTVSAGGNLVITGTVTDATCNGAADGAIDISVAGGSPPYQYAWSNGAITEDIAGLTAGTYTVTVVDDPTATDPCYTVASFTVNEPAAIDLNLDYDTYGAYACVAPTGGTSPYTVVWSSFANNTQNFTNCIYNLAPGFYSVKVTDANGCVETAVIVILAPPATCDAGTATASPSTILSGGTSTITLTGSTGVSIQWQVSQDANNWTDIANATAATYTTPPIYSNVDIDIYFRAKVTCSDGSIVYSTIATLQVIGNTNTDRLYEDVIDQLTKEQILDWTVYPTLNSGQFFIETELQDGQEMTLLISDMMGRVIQRETFDDEINSKFDIQGASGLYLISIQIGNQVQTKRIIVQNN